MDVNSANQFVSSGLDATHIKLVRSEDDLEDDSDFFHPDLCHQVFGESESIYGYRNLRLRIFYDANTFQSFVDFSFDDKIKAEKHTQPADDILEKLDRWLPDNFYKEKDQFVKYLNNRKLIKPFGQKIASYSLKTPTKKQYEVYYSTGKEAGFTALHERMETMIVWYIDAANYIDSEDEKWRFYVIYEKDESMSSTKYYAVGYCTVYEYFFYPVSQRYRISQFIVFPPYQNMGIGTELLRTVYKDLCNINNIFDITVEDPSDKFQIMRDFVDCTNCATLTRFQKPYIKGALSREAIDQARSKFKINEKQCRRVYEILRLMNTDEDKNEFMDYKLLVKSRLNAPFKKQQKHNTRLSKIMGNIPQVVPEQRLRALDKEFHNVLRQYRHIISRLSKTH